jgi:hypothetical protein
MQSALAPHLRIRARVVGGQHQHRQPLAFTQKSIVVGAEAEVHVAHRHQRFAIDDADQLDEVVRELHQMVGSAPGLSTERRGAEAEVGEPIACRGEVFDGDYQMVDAASAAHRSCTERVRTMTAS